MEKRQRAGAVQDAGALAMTVDFRGCQASVRSFSRWQPTSDGKIYAYVRINSRMFAYVRLTEKNSSARLCILCTFAFSGVRFLTRRHKGHRGSRSWKLQ